MESLNSPSVLCPLVTPFDGEDVSHDALATLVDSLIDAGLDGMVPCGTTGEFASLSDEEHEAVVSTTVEAAAGRVPVLAGAAATSVRGTLDAIAAADEAGADAALVTLPYFHTANASSGAERFLTAVAEDASLPLYLYNIPSCVGQSIPPSTVETVAAMENVRGLKDSSGDFGYFMELTECTPGDFELFQGFDTYLVPGLSMGSTGGIHALSNVIPEAFVAAADAVERGDTGTAARIQLEQIAPLFRLCLDHGFAPATKAALLARDLLPTDSVRPPLVELDAAASENVQSAVRDVVADYE